MMETVSAELEYIFIHLEIWRLIYKQYWINTLVYDIVWKCGWLTELGKPCWQPQFGWILWIVGMRWQARDRRWQQFRQSSCKQEAQSHLSWVPAMQCVRCRDRTEQKYPNLPLKCIAHSSTYLSKLCYFVSFIPTNPYDCPVPYSLIHISSIV